MEFKQIQCFLMVAKYLNFSTAAEQVFLSQPSLSRHISNLEKELGIQLFIRDKQSVSLTEAGLQCLTSARSILSASQDILDIAKNLREGRQGSLRIGYQASARIVLPNILEQFRRQYPNIDLFMEEIPAKHLMHKLHAGDLDIVFAFSVIQEGIAEYTYLNQHPLYIDRLALFMSWDRFLRHHRGKETYRLRDFKEDVFFQISYDNNPLYFNFLHSIYIKDKFTPWRIEEEDSMNTLMLLIQAGRGISLLPQYSTQEYYPSAHCIQLKDVDISMPIMAMWQPQNSNPCLPLMQALFPETPQIPRA